MKCINYASGETASKILFNSALVLPNMDIFKNDTLFKVILNDAFFARLLKRKSLIFALLRSLTISLHNIISI